MRLPEWPEAIRLGAIRPEAIRPEAIRPEAIQPEAIQPIQPGAFGPFDPAEPAETSVVKVPGALPGGGTLPEIKRRAGFHAAALASAASSVAAWAFAACAQCVAPVDPAADFLGKQIGSETRPLALP